MIKRNIVRSTAVVGICTGLSRVLGLLRLIMMASMFGTSLVQSAFVIAFRIPNLFRRLFGEGALSAAFIPVFAEAIEKEGRDNADILASRVLTMLGAFLAVLVIGGVVAISMIMAFVDLSPKAAAVFPLMRIMLPYMFFICLVALCMAILNTFHHFAAPALTPVVLNVVWILVLVCICPLFGDLPEERIYGVAWGILVAGGIQLAIQVPVLSRFGFRPSLSFSWTDPRVKRILSLMTPAALGMGVFQINVMIGSILAIVIGEWAPAALNFAEMVVYLPLGVFATALGTVLLPTFSEQAARTGYAEISKTLRQAIRLVLFVTLPATVGLVVLSQPITQLLFEWPGREFDAKSTELTARALSFYAPGLLVFSLYKVLVPVFYALKDTITPVRIAVKIVGLNLLLNVIFMFTWPDEYAHGGLAFATVISSAINCAALAWLLRNRVPSPGWAGLAWRGCKILVLSLCMGAVSIVAHNVVGLIMAKIGEGKLVQLIAVSVGIGAGVLTYLMLSVIFCRDELHEILAARSHRVGTVD